MAKAKRRVKSTIDASGHASMPSDASVAERSGQRGGPGWVMLCRRSALALMGGILVYAAYFPSDSVQVERGDALWFSVLCLILWTMTHATEAYAPQAETVWGKASGWWERIKRLDRFDACLWGLAGWIAVAAWMGSSPVALRQGTNEAWLWIAGAAFLTSARRLLVGPASRHAVVALLIGISAALAVHALHQQWISLPQMRADYLADPDALLRQAGVDAPRQSSARMVFANRLLDGGPTATFALANSLAAVLLLGVLSPIAVMRLSLAGNRSFGWNALLLTLAAIAMAALVATRSRSAIGACLVGVAWLWLQPLPTTANASVEDSPLSDSKCLRGRRPGVATVLAWVLALGAVLVVGVVLFGDEEWMAAAPASLEFRLQYWKSTLALVADHPLFGAGPGGFRSAYLAYRLPIASETIADPHNFFFETLAAGGLPAGILLAVVMMVWASIRKRQRSGDVAPRTSLGRDLPAEVSESRDASVPEPDGIAISEPDGTGFSDPDDAARWLLGGAAGTLLMVWLFGLLANQLPDVEASLFAIPVGLLSAALVHRVLRTKNVSDRPSATLGPLAVSGLVALMIHLCVSGGWTIPGVAVWIWLLAAAAIPVGVPAIGAVGESFSERAMATKSRDALVAFLLGATLVLTLRFVSLVPVQTAQAALGRANDALQRGMTPRVDSESATAVAADRWDSQAAIWRSGWLKNELVAGRTEAPVIRGLWEQAAREALTRSGDDPIATRNVADQVLHVYQRFGDLADLRWAAELTENALSGNPTEESLVAQAALIADQLGDRDRATELANRAVALSQLGNNVVRKLELVHVLAVEPLGQAAARNAVLVPVAQRFEQRFGFDREPVGPRGRSTETLK